MELALSYASNGDYEGHFRRTKSTVACNGDVGVAIFWRGGCLNGTCGTSDYFEDQWANEAGGERRAWACGYSGRYEDVYCSAHMSLSDSHAALQNTEYRLKLLGARNVYGITSVMMGDFNVTPMQSGSGMFHWYQTSQIVEMDSCSADGDGNNRTGCSRTSPVTNQYPAGLLQKLDYVFAAEGGMHCDRTGYAPGPYGNVRHSDHRFMRAYLTCAAS